MLAIVICGAGLAGSLVEQITGSVVVEESATSAAEDAFSFGRLMIFMFSNWYLAWILRLFPMCQVKR